MLYLSVLAFGSWEWDGDGGEVGVELWEGAGGDVGVYGCFI